MANTVRIKRSTGSSAPTSLENAELAFAESTEVLYYGKGTGGAGGSATTINAIGGKGKFWDKDTTYTANYVLAGPGSGSDAALAVRALVAADIPSIAHTKISDFDTGVQVNRLDQMAAPTAAVSLNSQKITSLAAPSNDNDAATKAYVDSTAEGLDVKDSCVVIATSNITLSNTQTIDGVSLAAGNRVLVSAQSTATQNGIYKVVDGGSWTREDDMATGADAAGAFTFIEQGTTNADTGWVCSSNKGSAVVGTNNLAFTQFSGSATFLPGDGLDKSGNTFSVDLKANGGLVIESTEVAVDLSASSITGTLAVGDGGTGATSASAARTALGVAIGSDVVAYAADLNTLSSCQSGGAAALAALTSTEIAILDGATLSTAELNYVDGVTSAIQTQLDAKQALDADLTALSSCQTGGAAALAALTSTEIEILDGATVTTAELNILDGVTSTTAELNILDGVTSTAAELNILDGVTATATELNTCCDGGTSATSTTLAATDRLVTNDNGTMVQVALSDLVTFLENGSVSGFDIDGGTY